MGVHVCILELSSYEMSAQLQLFTKQEKYENHRPVVGLFEDKS